MVSLREVPDGTLRLVIAPASKNTCPRVRIHESVGPLPDVADKVHHPERTGSVRVSRNRVRTTHGTTLVRCRDGCGVPFISPRVGPAICALRSVLPFPVMGQSLADRGSIRLRIFQ